MTLLTKPPQTEITVNGRHYPIRTRTAEWLIFEAMLIKESRDENYSTDFALLLEQLIDVALFDDEQNEHYHEDVRTDARAFIDAILDFYAAGRNQHQETEYETEYEKRMAEMQAEIDALMNKQEQKRIYDFDADASLVLAAFWQVYGLDDVQVQNLHWHVFLALFTGLPDTTRIANIMEIRQADPKKLKGAERKRIEKLQKIYALDPILPTSPTNKSPFAQAKYEKEIFGLYVMRYDNIRKQHELEQKEKEEEE